MKRFKTPKDVKRRNRQAFERIKQLEGQSLEHIGLAIAPGQTFQAENGLAVSNMGRETIFIGSTIPRGARLKSRYQR